MTLTHIDGDLLLSTETYLCHQCNCVTKRAAHLSYAVFQAFPYSNVYAMRAEHSKPGTIAILGDGGDKRLVINMFGQVYPGYAKWPASQTDGLRARQTYFKRCLKSMEELKGDFAFPHGIGCGAAGGDWEKYLEMIQDFSEKIDGDVVIYKLKKE